MEVFLGTHERVRYSRGKRAISVRAIEVLLWIFMSPELYDFNILAFSETWLGTSTLTEDINLESCLPLECKDRTSVTTVAY